MKIAQRTLALVTLALLLAAGKPLRAANTPAAGAADAAAEARAAASADPLLEALLTELERSKAQLKMEQVQAPYYIEYRVHDVHDCYVEAAFGAAREEQNMRGRVLRVVVRVGDYKQDSFIGQGIGETAYLPLDNDPIALRRQIWLATDEAYKAAGESLTEKQAYMKQFAADANPVDDFARATPVTAVGPLVALGADGAAWRKTLEDATSLYREYPAVQSLTGSARFTAVNEYFVNSEGTVMRSGRTTYTVTIGGFTQAGDGMRLARSPYWTVGRPEELPARAALLADTKKTLETLVALREAPIAEEEYRGPVLFAADAADDMFAGLVGENILGRKPQPGSPKRTTGAFDTSYKARVLPAFLTVVDDPTAKQFQGKSLVGSYEVDSEGVRAQAVTAVDKGILASYLLGRLPIRDFPASNGHGRTGPGGIPQPSIGNLFIRTSQPQAAAALRQQVLEMVRAQGKPYGYRVDTLGPGNSPRLLYRLYEKDGHEELIRGAVFSELDIRTLRNNLIAAGDDPLVSNRASGLPAAVISPSVLFDELEVKRADTSKDKLPDYPPPPFASAAASTKK
ncbi:MAG: peptidase U62 [Acidobacteriia bacterium]|nr:peptidase U62 [Terriglobia bacterium]